MRFFIYTEDVDDGLAIRQATRDAHLAWLKADNDAVKLLAAGPWLDDEGTMRGSLVIVEAASKSVVEDWCERDPYKHAGLPKSITIKAFNWVIGAPD